MLTGYNSIEWESLWDDLAPAFESESGLDVDVESSSSENYLGLRLRHDDPPDVGTATFGEVAPWRSERPLEPTTEVVSAARELNGGFVVEPYTDGRDYWQVPHGYQAATLTYRTDVYERLGLDVPTSFRGVVENAQAIDDADVDIRGYGLPARKTGKSVDEFQAYLARAGVSPVGLRWADPDAREELEVHFPETEVTAVLGLLEELSAYSPEPTRISWPQSVERWVGGRVAQQLHLNVGPAPGAAPPGATGAAENTGIAPLPYWEAGGIGRADSWAYEPTLSGHFVFSDGDSASGALAWLEWLYADDAERAARLFTPRPTRLLPAYDGIVEKDTYRTAPAFEENPRLLEQADYVRETIVGDHYGNVPESDLSDPVVAVVGVLGFYGEMVNLVVTGRNTPQEAYEWGLGRLETRLREARQWTSGWG